MPRSNVADEADIVAMMIDGKNNSEIRDTLKVSSERLRNIRRRLVDEGTIENGPRRVRDSMKKRPRKPRQPPAQRAQIVEVVESKPPIDAFAPDDLDDVDDDGMTLVENGYLRALEVIAELAREGIEQRAEIARLKA